MQHAASWAGHLMGLPALECADSLLGLRHGLLDPRLRGHCTYIVMVALSADMGSCSSFDR